MDLEKYRTNAKAMFRAFDLQDLRGSEFLRLLRLAQTEGLLPQLLKEAVARGSAGVNQTHALEPSAAPETQAIPSPVPRPRYPRISFGLRSLKQWFRSISWLRFPAIKRQSHQKSGTSSI